MPCKGRLQPGELLPEKLSVLADFSKIQIDGLLTGERDRFARRFAFGSRLLLLSRRGHRQSLNRFLAGLEDNRPLKARHERHNNASAIMVTETLKWDSGDFPEYPPLPNDSRRASDTSSAQERYRTAIEAADFGAPVWLCRMQLEIEKT